MMPTANAVWPPMCQHDGLTGLGIPFPVTDAKQRSFYKLHVHVMRLFI